MYENLESFRYFGFYPQYDKESRFKDLDLQSESKVYTESNPTNPKTITQSTTQNRSDAQSHLSILHGYSLELKIYKVHAIS